MLTFKPKQIRELLSIPQGTLRYWRGLLHTADTFTREDVFIYYLIKLCRHKKIPVENLKGIDWPLIYKKSHKMNADGKVPYMAVFDMDSCKFSFKQSINETDVENVKLTFIPMQTILKLDSILKELENEACKAAHIS